jgi:hypothetical protein
MCWDIPIVVMMEAVCPDSSIVQMTSYFYSITAKDVLTNTFMLWHTVIVPFSPYKHSVIDWFEHNTASIITTIGMSQHMRSLSHWRHSRLMIEIAKEYLEKTDIMVVEWGLCCLFFIDL